MRNNLQRFIDAQQNTYPVALEEIKRCRKQTHWMWYIFPQIQGLGFSSTSMLYAIRDLNEAQEYIKNPILGTRLKEISNLLLQLQENSATKILGTPDDMKLKSSMTLFSLLPEAGPVFQSVLDKFFEGKADEKTLAIIKND